MFNRDVNFFDTHQYCHIAPENSKRLIRHFKPREMPYNLELLPNTPRDSQCCSFNLIPTKLSDTTISRPRKQHENPSTRKRKHQRKSENIHIVKEKQINEQATDDSILNGLQTVIDLCGLLEKFDSKSKYKEENQNGLNFPCKERLHNSPQNKVNTSLQRSLSSVESINFSKWDENYDIASINSSQAPYNQVFQIYQAKSGKKKEKKEKKKKVKAKKSKKKLKGKHPSESEAQVKEKSIEKIIEDEGICKGCPTEGHYKNIPCDPLCSPPAKQLSKQSLNKRQNDDKHQSVEKRHSDAEMPATENAVTSKEGSSRLSLIKDMRCKDKGCCRDSDAAIPCVRVRTSEKEVCIQTKCQKVLSSKCFPPVEIAPCNLSCGECHAVGKVDPELFAKFDDDCECKHPTKSKSSTYTSKGRVPVEFKKSRLGFPIPQPIIGFCNNCQCGGDSMRSVKYAMAKITEFEQYSIYEVMQPYKETPKNIPICIAEIFVVSSNQQKRIFSVSAPINRPCNPRGGHPSTRISFDDGAVIVGVCGQQPVTEDSNSPRKPSCASNPQPSLLRFGSQEGVKTDKC